MPFVIDALDDEERPAALAARASGLGLPFFRISGVTGAGVPELIEAAWRELAAAHTSAEAAIELADLKTPETSVPLR